MYSCTGVVILSSKATVRNLLAAVLTAIFSVTLADAVFHISNIINPGVSNIYNALGTQIAPNMVTVVIFDFRAYDTLGESIILLTAEDYWGINDESRQHDFKTYIFTNFNHIDLFRDNDHSWRTYNSWWRFPRWCNDS